MDLTNNADGKYLCKYLPFNQYSLQILINNKFWIGPPDLLNDPFEGDFIIKNLEQLHNESCIRTLLQLTKSKDFEDDYNKMMNDSNAFTTKLYEHINKQITSNYGSTSFSKNCDNLRMWSHYADSHKGFIIVFDREILECTIADGITKIIDVEYTGLPEIFIEHKSNNFFIRDYGKMLTKKLSDWSMEDEVRIIRKYEYKYDFHRFLKFNRQCFKGIIYGERINFENLITIDRTLKDLHKELKFCLAKKNQARNKIIFEQIKYDI